MKCAFVAHSVPCKTMTLLRPNIYLKDMYISFAFACFLVTNKIQ